MTQPPRILLLAVAWLSRLGGLAAIVGGIGMLVTAWKERAPNLILVGVVTLAFGLTMTGAYAPPGGHIQFQFPPFKRPSRPDPPGD